MFAFIRAVTVLGCCLWGVSAHAEVFDFSKTHLQGKLSLYVELQRIGTEELLLQAMGFDEETMASFRDVAYKNYEKSVPWFKAEAERGEAEALKRLGIYHYYGLGVAKDKRKALKFFNNAALKNDCEATCYLAELTTGKAETISGRSNHNGWSHLMLMDNRVPANTLQGKRWGYRQNWGYEGGSDTFLAEFYGVAEQNSLKLSAQDFATFTECAGYTVFSTELLSSYVNMLEVVKEARLGNSAAKQALGTRILLLDAIGINQSTRQRLRDAAYKIYSYATPWYQRSATDGDLTAKQQLAFGYLYGLGLHKNVEQAKVLFRECALKGKSTSMYQLGRLLEKAHEVTHGSNKSIFWYTKAVEEGNNAAINALARCYENGRGVSKDVVHAFKLYELAACNGSVFGAQDLGRCAVNLLGVGTAPEQIFITARKLAKLPFPETGLLLGLCYATGLGTKVNPDKDFEITKRCVDNGALEVGGGLLAFSYPSQGKQGRDYFLSAGWMIAAYLSGNEFAVVWKDTYLQEVDDESRQQAVAFGYAKFLEITKNRYYLY